MARNTLVEDRVFTEVELAELQDHKIAVKNLGKQAENIAESLAYHLWDINRKKLYEAETKADGSAFKGIVDYAEYTFGISKGTTSDSVNTFERFGNPELKAIAPKYAEYRFSNLMAIKKLSDSEIEEAGITPNDGRSAIKDKLKALGVAQEQANALPDLRTRCVEQWNNFISLYMSEYGKPNTPAEFEANRYGKELMESFGTVSPEIATMDYTEVDKLLNMLKRFISEMQVVPNEDSLTVENEDSSTVETKDTSRPTASGTEDSQWLTVSKETLEKVFKLLEKETKSKITRTDNITLYAE